MSATITTTLTDNSKEWVESLKKRFVEGGGAAEDFEKHLEGLNNELASREAQKQTETIKKLADELDGTAAKAAKVDHQLEALNKELASRAAQQQAQEIRDLADAMDGTALKASLLKSKEDDAADAIGRSQQATIGANRELRRMDDAAYRAAKQAGTLAEYHRDLHQALNDRKVREYRAEIDKLADAMSRKPSGLLGGISQGFTALKGAALPAAAALFALWQGAKMGAQAIQYFADSGVPAFKRLADEGQKALGELVAAASDSRFSNFADLMAVGTKKVVIPLIRGASEVTGNLLEITTLATQAMMKLAGVSFKDQVRELKEEARQISETLSRVKKEMANEKKVEARKEEATHIGDARDDQFSGKMRDKEVKGMSDRGLSAGLQQAAQDMAAAKAAMATADDAAYERAKRQYRQAEEDRERLDNEIASRKQAKEEKESAGRIQRFEQQTEAARKSTDTQIAFVDAALAREKAAREQSAVTARHLEEEKQKLIGENEQKNVSTFKKRQNDVEIEKLNRQLEKEQKNASEIERLEKKRAELVEKNRKRERDSAKDRADLERITHEQEMARLEEKSKKEIENAQLQIRAEEEVDKFKKMKQAEEDAAHSKKVDQLKELLNMQTGGGGQNGFGGGPGGPMGNGGSGSPPGKSFADQLKAVINPKATARQVIKRREDEAVERWKSEKQNNGEMDANGNMIDKDGEFDWIPDAEKKRRLRGRAKSQEATTRRTARQGAMKDIRTGKVGSEEMAAAQGDLMAQTAENLISSGKLSDTQVEAIRKVVQQLSEQNATNAQLQEQLNGIMSALDAMQNGKGKPPGKGTKQANN